MRLKNDKINGSWKKINLEWQQYQNKFWKTFLYVFLAGKCLFSAMTFIFHCSQNSYPNSHRNQRREFSNNGIRTTRPGQIFRLKTRTKTKKRENNNEKRRKAHPFRYKYQMFRHRLSVLVSFQCNLKKMFNIFCTCETGNWNAFKIGKG